MWLSGLSLIVSTAGLPPRTPPLIVSFGALEVQIRSIVPQGMHLKSHIVGRFRKYDNDRFVNLASSDSGVALMTYRRDRTVWWTLHCLERDRRSELKYVGKIVKKGEGFSFGWGWDGILRLGGKGLGEWKLTMGGLNLQASENPWSDSITSTDSLEVKRKAADLFNELGIERPHSASSMGVWGPGYFGSGRGGGEAAVSSDGKTIVAKTHANGRNYVAIFYESGGWKPVALTYSQVHTVCIWSDYVFLLTSKESEKRKCEVYRLKDRKKIGEVPADGLG